MANFSPRVRSWLLTVSTAALLPACDEREPSEIGDDDGKPTHRADGATPAASDASASDASVRPPVAIGLVIGPDAAAAQAPDAGVDANVCPHPAVILAGIIAQPPSDDACVPGIVVGPDASIFPGIMVQPDAGKPDERCEPPACFIGIVARVQQGDG